MRVKPEVVGSVMRLEFENKTLWIASAYVTREYFTTQAEALHRTRRSCVSMMQTYQRECAGLKHARQRLAWIDGELQALEGQPVGH